MQKEVYGLGYPSLPILTVDEFYEKRLLMVGGNLPVLEELFRIEQ